MPYCKLSLLAEILPAIANYVCYTYNLSIKFLGSDSSLKIKNDV